MLPKWGDATLNTKIIRSLKTGMRWVAVLFVLTTAVWTQQKTPPKSTPLESISLGSVSVYLGEQKTETIAALVTAGYKLVSSAGDKSSFTVSWQNGSTPPLIGIVSFDNDRLSFVNKSWDPAGSSDYDYLLARSG